MLYPELRYLVFPEERNDERNDDMIQFNDKQHVLTTIFVFVLASISWFTYKLFVYSGTPAKYLLTALWHSITSWNDLLDLAIIISTLILGIGIIFVLKCTIELLDKVFIKLKNDLNKKDERIRELEAKIKSLEEVGVSTDQKANKISFQ